MQVGPEQLTLLRELAEGDRTVSRDDRLYIFIRTFGESRLLGPITRSLSAGEELDLDDLATAGLLHVRRHTESGYDFTVSHEAHELLKEKVGAEPLRMVEEEIVHRYLDGAGFERRYPDAHRSWSDAARLLWSENAADELTTIGHKSREAVQQFATSLVVRDGLTEVDANPARTVSRIRSVLEHHRDSLAEARFKLLDALISYWGEVNDLLQRQEHGAQKEGEPLGLEDGRAVVFQTALVMYEIDRVLYRPASNG